ncbi:hypothetical protein [Spirilliplanes yamanashiensis]|nr:hypothetical protein [Spirilliplanes yamanashiensis]MDP9817436.1 hypothetical protein [Spirilliplanes yamanashiensis]
MEPADDGPAVAASLAERLAGLTFTDLTTDEATAAIIDAVAGWGAARGWRVYRRAPSVVPLPPPLQRQHSVLDVAFARPGGRPVAVEVDHTHRARTVDKLLAEAGAGRVAIWVRWGPGRFTAPPEPVRMVTLEVARRAGRHTLAPDRPPPAHSGGAAGDEVELF